MPLAIDNITFDCSDAGHLCAFWAKALGCPVDAEATAFFALLTPDDGLRLLFLQVPEPKAIKNRLHFDLAADDRPAEVERLLHLGAMRISDHDEFGHSWTVLADPEGNEFCVVQKGPRT